MACPTYAIYVYEGAPVYELKFTPPDGSRPGLVLGFRNELAPLPSEELGCLLEQSRDVPRDYDGLPSKEPSDQWLGSGPRYPAPNDWVIADRQPRWRVGSHQFAAKAKFIRNTPFLGVQPFHNRMLSITPNDVALSELSANFYGSLKGDIDYAARFGVNFPSEPYVPGDSGDRRIYNDKYPQHADRAILRRFRSETMIWWYSGPDILYEGMPSTQEKQEVYGPADLCLLEETCVEDFGAGFTKRIVTDMWVEEVLFD